MFDNSFLLWLGQQTDRTDAVGSFAKYAMRDKVIPQQSRLYYFLLRYEGMPEQREGVKRAHAEWRRVRAAKAVRR